MAKHVPPIGPLMKRDLLVAPDDMTDFAKVAMPYVVRVGHAPHRLRNPGDLCWHEVVSRCVN